MGKFDALTEMLQKADSSHLERVLARHFELLVDDPLFERVTARAEPALKETARVREELLAQLSVLVERGRETRLLRGDVDAGEIVLVVCGLAHAARAAALTATSRRSQAMLRVLFEGISAS